MIGIAFLGSSQWSIRSAQCCVSFRARAEKRERSVANVEFRSRGAAVDVDQICFGLAPAPIVLAGHLLDCVVRNSEIRRDRLIPDANKNTNKLNSWS